MDFTFLDGNKATSTVEGFEGTILFPEVMDKHAYKAYRTYLNQVVKEQGDEADPADDYGRVYVTLLNPETGTEEEAPMAFSFSIASLGMRLVKQWDGFAEGVRPLLTPDNADLNGLPMAFVALLSRATGDWVSRQLSFRLDSRPGLPE